MTDLKTFYSNIFTHVIDNLNTTVNMKVSTNHRGYRNCISPSQLKLAKDYRKQSLYFFNPDILLELDLCTEKEYDTITRSKEMNSSGYINCTLGTFVHELLLYPVETYARSLGHDIVVEMPVCSLKYGVYGTADLVFFDGDYIHLLDLKTCGNTVLERETVIPKDYQRQAYTYMTSLLEMFPDKKPGSIHILSLNKTPGSSAYTAEGNKVLLPLMAIAELNWQVLKTEYGTYLSEVSKQTFKILRTIKEAHPTFESWVLDGEYPVEFELAMSEVDERQERV